jgi:hypothetical protein
MGTPHNGKFSGEPLLDLDLPQISERKAYLNHACGDNSQLRAEVEALLRAHEKPQGILDVPETSAATIGELSAPEGPGTVIGLSKPLA